MKIKCQNLLSTLAKPVLLKLSLERKSFILHLQIILLLIINFHPKINQIQKLLEKLLDFLENGALNEKEKFLLSSRFIFLLLLSPQLRGLPRIFHDT